MGRSLERIEAALRTAAIDGYLGGIVLFLALGGLWCGVPAALILLLHLAHPWLALAFHVFWLYFLIAFRDLVVHVWRVQRAAGAGDLEAARRAVSMLVGRDTGQMDRAACRRAAIESLAENLVDGVLSPLFWYCLLGLPGVTLFKVVSTMDSMVGYKSPRYLRFGWCGARADDLMNWLPARICWLLVALAALPVPGCSSTAALRTGWRQHALVPGPNSGWSEAAFAGALRRRLAGPIYAGGVMVTDTWLGSPDDPPGGSSGDVSRAVILAAIVTALFLAAISAVIIATG
jgi:adenosylcobinamide-phosphate synthase